MVLLTSVYNVRMASCCVRERKRRGGEGEGGREGEEGEREKGEREGGGGEGGREGDFRNQWSMPGASITTFQWSYIWHCC